jgi:SAM-dependent methyltransferase
LALLERIVHIGSNEGDLILDPFCGTGTALIAAQVNGRRWLGSDLSAEACSITVTRLESTFDVRSGEDFFFGDHSSLERFPVVQNSYGTVLTGLERNLQQKFVLHQPLPIEETRHYEFKELKGANPVNPIKDAADEYVVAFLNNEGGRIYWGIRDSDRVVVGVRLTYAQRDEIRRVVTEKLTKIQPAVAPTAYRIELHQVYDQDVLSDLYVVEVTVPRVSSTELYFTSKGDAWVKTDGGKKRLIGPEILEEYRRRLPM